MVIGNRRAADCAWGDGLAPSGEFELRDLGAANVRLSELQESKSFPVRIK